MGRRVASNSRSRKSHKLRSALSPTQTIKSREAKFLANTSAADLSENTNEENLLSEKLNPKIVERWISTTLEDAKYLDLPGKFQNFYIIRDYIKS